MEVAASIDLEGAKLAASRGIERGNEGSHLTQGPAPDEPPSIAMERLDFAVGFGLW